MKYSILYLNYDPEHKLCDMVKESLHSIVSNSVGHNYEIIVLDRKGLRPEVNRGFRQARGEYIVLIANDVIIQNNWLDYLAVPNKITSSKKTTSYWHPDGEREEVDGAVICFPRNIREAIGDWDENFEGGYGYCDNDYLYRASLLGFEFEEVPIKVEHKMSATFDAYNMKQKEGMERNKEYLLKKHKLI